MAGTLTLNKVIKEERSIAREYVFKPSGNYTAGNALGVAGEVLNFMAPLNPKGHARAIPGPVPTPTVDDVYEVRCPGGYQGVVEANAVSPTFSNMILRFFGSGGSELTGAPTAYPAGLLGLDVLIRVTLPKKQG